MNWDLIQGDWMQFKDKVRKNWAKLTDEDLTRIGGRRDELIGRLQAATASPRPKRHAKSRRG
jgi:uncharacterized protein YjbJ (UPF0337 family)